MSRPIVDYLIALAVCLGAAIGYRATVVPLLSSETSKLVAVRQQEDKITGPDVSDVFPADSWQRDRPKVLQASWGMLLFEQWQQVAADRWQVAPVSVVLRRDADEGASDGKLAGLQGGEGTIILDAPEGAIVEFAEPLNMLTSGSPRIKGGQLLGAVHIHSQASAEHPEEALDLRARNVRIDSRQIRSAEPIELRVGGMRFSGRDLTIHLAGGGTIPTGMRNSPLSVLDSMELIYLHDLSVPLPEGALWEPLEGIGSPLPPGAAPPPGKLSVRCGGRVVFDFTTYMLRLADGVEVRHQSGRAPDDTFRCRELLMQLADPFADPAPAGQHPPSAMTKAAATLRRIEARGAPGAPIDAQLPSLDSRIQAAELIVDVADGSLRLAGTANANVELVHHGFRFAVPELTYQVNPRNPEELGTLVTLGNGNITCQDPQIPLREISWNETLQLLHDDDGHHLWVAGKVRLRMGAGDTVGADSALLTFELPDAAAGGSAGAATDSQPLGGLRPEKLRASGNVVVDTAAFGAETELLQVWFEHLDPAATPNTAPAADRPKLNPATGTPLRHWVTAPEGGGGNAVTPVAGPRATLRGHTVQAQLVLRDGEIVARDLTVVKDVRLEHELQTEGGRLPLVYTGGSLRLKSGGGEELIQITGRPARIELGDGYFEGPLVLVSGAQNRVWIRDSGTFQMPSAVLPRATGGTTQFAGPPRCDFRGELTFDGQLIEIGSEVRLSAKMRVGEAADLWEISATAPKLEVALDRGISVTEPTAAREAGIERVSLVGLDQAVWVTARNLDATGNPLSAHVLNNPRMDFFAASGQLQGGGPGWYRSWAASDESSPLRSISPPGSVMTTHLIYNGGIEGDLSRQQIAFVRGVRVGMATVPSWQHQIDAATMSQLQLNQGTVDCDRLQIGRAPGTLRTVARGNDEKNVPWELQALGGVAFKMMTERGLVDGTATRVAYDAGGDMFRLEGSPQRAAVISQTSPTGDRLFQGQLPIMEVDTDTLNFSGRIQGVTVGALPGLSR